MIINVRVFPRARKNLIKEENGVTKVYTSAPAVDNKANLAVQEMLAEFFRVRKSQVVIKRGDKSRNKVVEICV